MPHEVLFCSELLGLICQNCDLHTLSQLSLTNRTISYSALHVLWSSIENFGPLIRCMPEDLWKEHLISSAPETRYLSFRRPIRDTDYERFLLRAAHVRAFGFPSGTISYKIEKDALVALCCAAGKNMMLLPQVQKLDASLLCIDHAGWGLPCIGCLLSPTITQVDIYTSIELLLSILPTLVVQCPSVTEVRLMGPEQDSVLARAVSPMHQWSDLQSLVAVLVRPAGVLSLSSLPALKKLEVAYIDSPSGPIPKISKGFSTLEKLVIEGCASDFNITLMRCMNRTPMKSISVRFQGRIPLDAWFCFLVAMRDGVVHDRIQSITLDCAEGQKFNQPFSTEMISPLLCYINLSSIHLKSLHGIDFDDDTINAMASSWKELRKFQVETDWQSWAPRATYKSLISFARHNPRLEELAIPFDATTITKDILNLRPWKGIRNESLRTLTVRRSPIAAPDLVADFLIDIFPKLARIGVSVDLEARAHTSAQTCSVLYQERWIKVEILLGANTEHRNYTDFGGAGSLLN